MARESGGQFAMCNYGPMGLRAALRERLSGDERVVGWSAAVRPNWMMMLALPAFSLPIVGSTLAEVVLRVGTVVPILTDRRLLVLTGVDAAKQPLFEAPVHGLEVKVLGRRSFRVRRRHEAVVVRLVGAPMPPAERLKEGLELLAREPLPEEEVEGAEGVVGGRVGGFAGEVDRYA